MDKIYSFKTGIGKGLKFILTALAGIAVISGFSEISIWGLAEQYLKPILSTLTVGGLITIALNFVKTRFGGFKNLGKAIFK